MIVAPVIVLYAALACATVKPAKTVTPAGTITTKPVPMPGDLLGVCKALNEAGVQKHPSLNPN